jgi:hypothetical protein
MTPPHLGGAADFPEDDAGTGSLVYKGHRIEPASYAVNNVAWSPRVVVSVREGRGWARQVPLYATSAAKFRSREEADLAAIEVAKAWIDTELGRHRP